MTLAGDGEKIDGPRLDCGPERAERLEELLFEQTWFAVDFCT